MSIYIYIGQTVLPNNSTYISTPALRSFLMSLGLGSSVSASLAWDSWVGVQRVSVVRL